MKKPASNQSPQAIFQLFFKLDKIEQLLLKKVGQQDDVNYHPGNQLQVVFKFLKKYTATASMISAATGIPQKNICRYKRQLEKAGLIYQVEREVCEQTGHMAWYLSACSEKILKRSGQIRLF